MRSYASKSAILSLVLIAAFVLSAVGIHWRTSVATNSPEALGQMSQETESVILGMGCFWGAEKRMSALPGVVDVVSGYAGAGQLEAKSSRRL